MFLLIDEKKIMRNFSTKTYNNLYMCRRSLIIMVNKNQLIRLREADEYMSKKLAHCNKRYNEVGWRVYAEAGANLETNLEIVRKSMKANGEQPSIRVGRGFLQ